MLLKPLLLPQLRRMAPSTNSRVGTRLLESHRRAALKRSEKLAAVAMRLERAVMTRRIEEIPDEDIWRCENRWPEDLPTYARSLEHWRVPPTWTWIGSMNTEYMGVTAQLFEDQNGLPHRLYTPATSTTTTPGIQHHPPTTPATSSAAYTPTTTRSSAPGASSTSSVWIWTLESFIEYESSPFQSYGQGGHCVTWLRTNTGWDRVNDDYIKCAPTPMFNNCDIVYMIFKKMDISY